MNDLERPLEWEAAPSPRLRPYVERYCGLILPASLPVNFGQRSSPSGNVILQFVFGSGQVCETKYAYRPTATVKSRPNQAVILPKRTAWRVTLEDMTDIVLVKLKAGMAAPFLNLSLSELNTWENVDDIWSASALDPLNNLGTLSVQKRIQSIERVLLNRLKHSDFESDHMVNQALSLIQHARGCLEIQQLASHLNISSRQLRRKFQHHVGLTPKQFNDIVRFRYANHLMKQRPNMSLTDVAHHAGYFDLAHFTHAIHEISGIPPSQMAEIDQQALHVQKRDSDFIFLQAV